MGEVVPVHVVRLSLAELSEATLEALKCPVSFVHLTTESSVIEPDVGLAGRIVDVTVRLEVR